MNSSENRNLEKISIDSIFGTISCPKCSSFWVKDFVPEFCPECGSRVSYQAGRGMENHVEIIKQGKFGINILQCPNCKLRYPEIRGRKQMCFRCNCPLVNANRISNLTRKLLFHWRCLRYTFRNRR